MIMSDSLKKIAYWALVLTLIVAEIGSFFDLLNINPWCYPVYAALLILYNKFSSYNPISKNRISKIIAIGFIVVAVALTIRFLIVVGITALLIIIDLHRTKKS